MSIAHRFTVEEYDRMVEGEVFADRPDQRIELSLGELLDMNPPGPMHDEVVDRLRDWAAQAAAGRSFRVRTEKPISLPQQDSVPYPDLAIVKHRSYAVRRPEVEDVFLLVEVADTSLGYDRLTKSLLYASAGIQEYWIVNIPQKSIEVMRDPAGETYAACFVAESSATIEPFAFPGMSLVIARLFEPWQTE